MIHTQSTGQHRECTAAVSADLCISLKSTNGDWIATLPLCVAVDSLTQYTAHPIRVLSSSCNGKSCNVSLLSVLVGVMSNMPIR